MKVLQNAKNASKIHQNPFLAGELKTLPLANVWGSASDPAGGAIGAQPGPLAGVPHRLHFPGP